MFSEKVKEKQTELGITNIKLAELLAITVQTLTTRFKTDNWTPLEVQRLKKILIFKWENIL